MEMKLEMDNGQWKMEIGNGIGIRLLDNIDNGISPKYKIFLCLSPVNFASCEDLLLWNSIHIIIIIFYPIKF